jgi:hypothetical protein
LHQQRISFGDGGLNFASDNAKNTATALTALFPYSGFTAVKNTDGTFDLLSSTHFSGGGSGIAITTTLAMLKAALNHTTLHSDLVVAGAFAGSPGDGSTLCSAATTSITDGSDNVPGTPGWLGRKAIWVDGDGHYNEATCMMENLDGEHPEAWVTTYAGS